jgi:hypothetical protein
MTTRQPPTTTDDQSQRLRDHRVNPKCLLGNRLCFILCVLCASVVRKGTPRQTKPIWAAEAATIADWGLRIWDWGWEIRGASCEISRSCGRNAKQNQSGVGRLPRRCAPRNDGNGRGGRKFGGQNVRQSQLPRLLGWKCGWREETKPIWRATRQRWKRRRRGSGWWRDVGGLPIMPPLRSLRRIRYD